MAEIVVMPKIGLTAKEALLREWLVDEGQQVSAGEPLMEIETDKIVTEVESPATGVLLRRIEPDVVVPVGEPIAVIGDATEDVTAAPLFDAARAAEVELRAEVDMAPERMAEPRSGERTPRAGAGRLSASPVARKRAKELGLDLSAIVGTGPGGRITIRDIEKSAAHPLISITSTAAPSPSAEGRAEEPSRLRRAIANAMSLSAAVPQFSLERDLDVTGLQANLAERSFGLPAPLSLADAIGVAVARAIRRHEVFLRSWDEGVFRYAEGVHIGIAVAVEDGLIVPVLTNADRLTVEAFSSARRDLQERTLAGHLRAQESTGAVFTISNLGPFGVDRFRALVNPPESGILAIGRAKGSGGRSTLTLTLSADHRVVDGVQGARLMDDIARSLEDDDGHEKLFGPPGAE